MYALQQLEAYRTAQNSVLTGRGIEAAALTRCALMLLECQKNWDSPARGTKLADALRANQMVWSILQSELIKKDNPLPQQLKENILSLSLFIDKRILEVMANPMPEKLKIIVDINLNLAAGLKRNPENNGQHKEAQPSQVLSLHKRNAMEKSYRI